MTLFGIADTHTHPMSNLGFGGMIWGDWGAPIEELVGCDGSSHGGNYTVSDVAALVDLIAGKITGAGLPPLGSQSGGCRAAPDVKQDFSALIVYVLSEIQLPNTNQSSNMHKADGYPGFQGWPRVTGGVHQQYQLDWIRRAWEGGLRLMSALVVNNQLLSVFHAGSEQTDDDAFAKQIASLNEVAARPENASWMEIVDSPDHARDAIGHGKLAIVPGIEIDQLERLASGQTDGQSWKPPSGDPEDWVPALVQWLFDQGIRQVTPMHLADNSFGGFALYDDFWCTNSEYLNRLITGSDSWPKVAASDPADPVEFSLNSQEIQATPHHDVGPSGPINLPTVNWNAPPMRNARGLQHAGAVLLRELMSRGMLIDVDHMAQATLLGGDGSSGALAIAEFNAYPVISSHTAFRDLAFHFADQENAFQDAGKTNHINRPFRTERAHSDDVVMRLAALGGMVAPASADPGNLRVATRPEGFPQWSQDATPPGSSIAWASEYLHALQLMGGRHVAMATDFTTVPGCLPRFDLACNPLMNVTCNPLPMRDVASYKPRTVPNPLPRTSYGGWGLTQCVTGSRTFDVNTDGVCHFGMLPDLWEDLRSIGLSTKELAPLLNSAEGYIETWEECLARSSSVGLPPGV